MTTLKSINLGDIFAFEDNLKRRCMLIYDDETCIPYVTYLPYGRSVRKSLFDQDSVVILFQNPFRSPTAHES